MPWEQLQDIIKENRDERIRWEQTPPEACPIDGEQLDVHPNGSRNCPRGNYRWLGGPKEH